MELKFFSEDTLTAEDILLIVPYGIEIKTTRFRPLFAWFLLIVPYGIEIN